MKIELPDSIDEVFIHSVNLLIHETNFGLEASRFPKMVKGFLIHLFVYLFTLFISLCSSENKEQGAYTPFSGPEMRQQNGSVLHHMNLTCLTQK